MDKKTIRVLEKLISATAKIAGIDADKLRASIMRLQFKAREDEAWIAHHEAGLPGCRHCFNLVTATVRWCPICGRDFKSLKSG